MAGKKKWWISLSVAVVVAGAVGATALVAAGPKQGQGYQTPDEIGAYFLDDYALVEAADFEPSLPREKAEGIALEHLMNGFSIPQGHNLEDMMVVKSTTGLFSGARQDSGPWTEEDQEVWIVVIDDLPLSLPCGAYGPADCPFHPPRFNVAVDAATGEIIKTQLTGSGSRSEKWRDIEQNIPIEVGDPTPTPTPVPDEDDYCHRYPHNPNPVDPPPGGPTPTPVPDKDKACR